MAKKQKFQIINNNGKRYNKFLKNETIRFQNEGYRQPK